MLPEIRGPLAVTQQDSLLKYGPVSLGNQHAPTTEPKWLLVYCLYITDAMETNREASRVNSKKKESLRSTQHSVHPEYSIRFYFYFHVFTYS